MTTKMKLEVHTHHFVSGPRARFVSSSITHSHPDGSIAHQHPNTGPASYVIDKDEWFKATGLRGGGRKKYTAKPSGEQMLWVELEEWQKSFKIIICDRGEVPASAGEGPGVALPLRLVMECGMTISEIDDRTTPVEVRP
jgi:hypothetical protein